MLYKKTEKLSIIKREGEIMGMFVNPNAAAFQCAVNSEVYIDKTGLLEYTNKVLGTNARFICNSRPRRFATLKKCFQDWKSANVRIFTNI